MKILFLLLNLLLITTVTIAQDDIYYTSELKYPKKATKIILNTGLSKEDNFKKCQQFLADNEISTQASESTYIVKTDELNTKKRKYPYFLTFFCKDSLIVVTGKFKVGMTIQMYSVRSEDNFEPIINKGSKGSAYEITFSEMVSQAQSFGYPLSFRE